MIFRNIFPVLVVMVVFSSHISWAQDSMGSLKVVVKDFYDDTPIAGAQVIITPCTDSGVTDVSGEFTLNPVTPSRNYQVDVEADGYIKQSVGFVTVEANRETVSYVPMKQEATISGTITDGSSPVADVVVILGNYESDGESTYFVAKQSTVTGIDGLYSLVNVNEGSYKLVALADDYVKNMVDVAPVAGQNLIRNFSLTWQGSSTATASIVLRAKYNGDPLPLPTYKGKSVYCDGRGSTGAVNFFWLKAEVPPGSIPIGQEYYLGASQVYYFIVPASGNYEVKLFVDDSAGVISSASFAFSAVNVAPEAVASVIPGPSELPYLYNNQVYSSTTGSNFVAADSTVYLRGFGIDINLPSPAEFNPDAPCFDIYENKNGNFSASIFDYSWTLKDKNNTDLSSLLTPSSVSENVSFTVPGGAQAGDYYVASLTVTDDEATVSAPANVTITVANGAFYAACIPCHSATVTSYLATAHASVPGGADCQSCHGPESVHVADPVNKKLSSSNWSGVCGQCHLEFAELQKANHSDPLPFGYYEPSEGRLTSCYKCHYTEGYIGAVEQTAQPFHQFSYFPFTPISVVPKDTPNVSCSVCHDPHEADTGNPYGLRTGSAGTACDTCHYEKWQNAILEGLAGQFENAYHYPGEDYTPFLGANNPHRTAVKCVLCHMNDSLAVTDENGVRKIGGHTMRMRDYGNDQVPETADDILNIAICQACHPGVTDFNKDNIQTEVKGLLTTLADILKGCNHEFLPANEPGSCARCHKGGTVPFLNDPTGKFENAYTNYKLILNDRSWGIHNPGYVKKLLQDSIDSCRCRADITSNGKVDLNDLVIMKGEFMKFCPPSPCLADVDGNGKVDLADLVIMKSEFMRNDCPLCS